MKRRLKEIIAIVEESNVSEVEVSTWWGRKIRVTKYTNGVPQVATPPPPVTVDVPAPLPQSTVNQGSEPVDIPQKLTNGVEIKAPIVGTFYRSASPESPPYISVGDKVEQGQTICIIEAMKIMNEIDSDVSGTVVEILAENASPVEFNQPLVIVEPN